MSAIFAVIGLVLAGQVAGQAATERQDAQELAAQVRARGRAGTISDKPFRELKIGANVAMVVNMGAYEVLLIETPYTIRLDIKIDGVVDRTLSAPNMTSDARAENEMKIIMDPQTVSELAPTEASLSSAVSRSQGPKVTRTLFVYAATKLAKININSGETEFFEGDAAVNMRRMAQVDYSKVLKASLGK
ncbi:MAG: hypothetical protein WCJ29_04540 [bacterium]